MKEIETKMNLEITKEERALLLELLEAKDAAMYHEIHHTDSREFKEYLKQKWKLIEALKEKIKNPASSGTTQ